MHTAFMQRSSPLKKIVFQLGKLGIEILIKLNKQLRGDFVHVTNVTKILFHLGIVGINNSSCTRNKLLGLKLNWSHVKQPVLSLTLLKDYLMLLHTMH